MFAASVRRNDLTRLPQVVEQAQRQAEAEVRRRLLYEIGPAILEGAQKRCPVLWGDARRSGRMDVGFDRLTIGFGGNSPKRVPPSEYIEWLHEDPDKIERPGPRLPPNKKYVYLYLKGWAPRANAEGRMVEYAKRDLAANRPKIGMAYFLFGEPESALEAIWPGRVAQLETAVFQVFRAYMRM